MHHAGSAERRTLWCRSMFRDRVCVATDFSEIVVETESARAISLSSVLATIVNNWHVGKVLATGTCMIGRSRAVQGALGPTFGWTQLCVKLWYYGDGPGARGVSESA